MSYTRLRFHIITATKCRSRLITPRVEAVLYPALRAAAEDSGGKILALNGARDHTHWILALPATITLSVFVGRVEARASRIVRDAFPELGFRWQTGYAAFTVSPHDMSALFDYVWNQKKHHREGSTIPAFEHTA